MANLEIFNPSEWKRLYKTDGKNAKKTVDHIRKRNDITSYPIPSPVPHKQFDRFITLSSAKFNNLLGEGFKPGKLYLIYGAYATGKTQIGFHSCASLYNLYKDLKTPVSALFIDTEDTFRPERVKEIAENSYSLSDDTVLSRIRVLKAGSTEMIFTMLKKIDAKG